MFVPFDPKSDRGSAQSDVGKLKESFAGLNFFIIFKVESFRKNRRNKNYHRENLKPQIPTFQNQVPVDHRIDWCLTSRDRIGSSKIGLSSIWIVKYSASSVTAICRTSNDCFIAWLIKVRRFCPISNRGNLETISHQCKF